MFDSDPSRDLQVTVVGRDLGGLAQLPSCEGFVG